jgi:hypothetical protein
MAVAGCGQAVHDLSVPTTPLVTVHGHVDTTALARPHPAAPLLGALIWAAVPGVNPVCVETASQQLVPSDPNQVRAVASACPDAQGVFPGQPQVWVPIGPDGNFDLVLYTLPAISVSVGDGVTRVAYGSLIVFEDVNGDGQPTLPRLPTGEGRRRAVVGPQPSDPDRIVAASFYALEAPQQRIVFREGDFVTPSFFYPAPGPGVGCEPPPGFSIETAPPYADPPVSDCAFSKTDDTRLELVPLSDAEGLAFLCRGLQTDATVNQPIGDEPPPQGGATNVCYGHGVLAVVYHLSVCTVLRSYALAGCQQDPLCATPEWNINPSLLNWQWPCP